MQKVMAGGNSKQQIAQWEYASRGFKDGCSAAYYTHKRKALGAVEIVSVRQMIRYTRLRPEI